MQRQQEQDRADRRGGRIARKPEDPNFAEAAVHQRLAGTHGDLPEAELHAGRNQRLLHEVVVADRGAAERHQHVDLRLDRLADRGVELGHVVAGDAEIDRNAAAGLDDPGDGEIVGGDDLRGAERSAGRDQFVAGGEDRDPGVAAYRQP